MNAYLMLLEAEENQLSDLMDDRETKKGFLSVAFTSVWNFIKKLFNTSKDFIKRNLLKVHPLLRWGALTMLVAFAINWFVSNPVLNYFGSKFESVKDLITKHPTTTQVILFLAIALIVALLFYFVIRYRNRKRANIASMESRMWDDETYNILMEEEEQDDEEKQRNEKWNKKWNQMYARLKKRNMPDNIINRFKSQYDDHIKAGGDPDDIMLDPILAEKSKSLSRSIFDKLKNFFTANYKKVRDFIASKVNWSSRSLKVRIGIGVAVAAIIGLLFSMAYFKLEGRPIKDIFTMLANFVSNNMYGIGLVMGVLLIAVGIHYLESKIPKDITVNTTTDTTANTTTDTTT